MAAVLPEIERAFRARGLELDACVVNAVYTSEDILWAVGSATTEIPENARSLLVDSLAITLEEVQEGEAG